jgi:hypothetical protein
MKRLLNQLLPFVMIGIALIAFGFGIMLLAYLFFFGAIFGLILFVINWVRQTFFSPPPSDVPSKQKRTSNRIIDSDDWRRM